MLLIALGFLLLFALFIPALLGSTGTNLSVSGTLSVQRNELFAAEAGLRTRVEAIRQSRTTAVYGQSCGPTAVGTFNGEQVRVQCAPQPSSGDTALTRPPYALLALPSLGSSLEGITDQPTVGGGGGTSDVYVGGDIASNGKIEHVANGAVSHFYVSGTARGHSCVGGNIDDPATNGNVCSVVATNFPDPGASSSGYAKTGGFPAALDPAATCLANATRFAPGYYTHMPSAPGGCASKPWWFGPGLYYFDFVTGAHVLDLTARTVVAGTPNLANFNPTSGSAAPVMPGSCKVDGDIFSTPANGVEWVFGADTVLTVGSSGKVELCPTTSTTAQEISIRGYGAAGEAAPAPTTTTEHPTANVQTPNTAYVSGPSDTGPSAYAIDGITANSAVGSNSTSMITLKTIQDIPAGASVATMVLKIKHQETYTGTGAAPAISAVVHYGATSATVGVGCGSNQLCRSSTSRLDSFDITAPYLASGSTIPAVSVDFGVDSPRNTTTNEALDGVELDVTYVSSGAFRLQSGCAILPVGTAGQCDTVSNDPGALLYVQGTVYAPLGRVDITTASGDPVQLNRGVIARDIRGAIHPGNGSANPFGIGRPKRLALLTAEVSTDGVHWTPRLESLVRFDDNIATGTTRGRVTYISWHVLR